MKVVPISAHLVEFTSDPSLDDVQLSVPEPDVISIVKSEGGVRSNDPEKKFQERIVEGEKRAKAEYEQQLEDQKAKLSEQHELEVATLHDQFSRQILDKLTRELGELETRLAETLEVVVKPFVSSSLKSRIIAELRSAIADILRDDASCQFIVQGPEALLKSLETSLAATTPVIRFIENDDPEVSITMADTKIETRLKMWSQLLESEVG